MKKVVVLGGGTGNFVVLSGLKKYDVDLSTVVSMADDGGSTGVLRDELGVLPPGDVRQCLVALSDSSRLMRSLMNYRFENGGLAGHSFGNILLSALEKVTGSFDKAVEEAGRILSIKGKVIPITNNEVRLHMVLADGTLLKGESEVLLSQKSLVGFKSIYLEPFPKVDSHAIDEIMNADLIVFGPGGLYTSLIPILLVEGISKAFRDSKAKKLFIVNMMNKKALTPGFKASDYLSEIKRFVGRDVFDHVLLNNKKPSPWLIRQYEEEAELIEGDLKDERVISTDLLDTGEVEQNKNDAIAKTRALVRHDSKKIATEIINIVNNL